MFWFLLKIPLNKYFAYRKVRLRLNRAHSFFKDKQTFTDKVRGRRSEPSGLRGLRKPVTEGPLGLRREQGGEKAQRRRRGTQGVGKDACALQREENAPTDRERLEPQLVDNGHSLPESQPITGFPDPPNVQQHLFLNCGGARNFLYIFMNIWNESLPLSLKTLYFVYTLDL